MGNGYNTTTGLFTANVVGTYVFIWHAMTHNYDSGTCYLHLYISGTAIQFTAVANSQERAGGTDSASNSAVLTLDTGDTVGIRTGSCGYLWARPFTSFSGFKLWLIDMTLYSHCYVVNSNIERDVSFYDILLKSKGISSNIMKSPSPKCYMTFWDMIINSNTLHWSDISLNRDLVTGRDLITVLALLPYSGKFQQDICNGCGDPTEDAYYSGNMVVLHLGLHLS